MSEILSVIRNGPINSSESFRDGRRHGRFSEVIQTLSPTQRSGGGSLEWLACAEAASWVRVICSWRNWWSQSRSITYCLAYLSKASLSGWTASKGLYPLLAKNGETLVVAFRALLYANSARGRRSDQFNCW